jgi:hypothetical protein
MSVYQIRGLATIGDRTNTNVRAQKHGVALESGIIAAPRIAAAARANYFFVAVKVPDAWPP